MLRVCAFNTTCSLASHGPDDNMMHGDWAHMPETVHVDPADLWTGLIVVRHWRKSGPRHRYLENRRKLHSIAKRRKRLRCGALLGKALIQLFSSQAHQDF
ncbi:hypothetical protein LshimejAT787_0506460 [Lyophyllum shimeji]|uniref:Uncharacterized protein n=1 Tax=Lyophyllum shimeji TaxID=47721 RepID=A0A9P3PNA3_LYOSH|nr:hypothetical protein LshimejAT787_0506460 [Lyophyllum shimeji]